MPLMTKQKGKHMFKKIISTLLVTLFSIGLVGSIAGCNTVAGIGADVERGGQKLENAAENAKK